MPSMRMLPSCRSRRRSSVRISEDLPLPVRPQIPTFCPGLIVRDTLCRTGSVVGLWTRTVSIRVMSKDLCRKRHTYSSR